VRKGVDAAIAEDASLARGVNIRRGEIISPALHVNSL
jgi:alanine dehydrogenase